MGQDFPPFLRYYGLFWLIVTTYAWKSNGLVNKPKLGNQSWVC